MIDNKKAIKIMKVVMVLGICLFLLGHYLLTYTSVPETYGIKGLAFSGGLMAVGLIMSLPTKMYLTFVWVKGENDRKEKEREQKRQQAKQG